MKTSLRFGLHGSGPDTVYSDSYARTVTWAENQTKEAILERITFAYPFQGGNASHPSAQHLSEQAAGIVDGCADVLIALGGCLPGEPLPSKARRHALDA